MLTNIRTERRTTDAVVIEIVLAQLLAFGSGERINAEVPQGVCAPLITANNALISPNH